MESKSFHFSYGRNIVFVVYGLAIFFVLSLSLNVVQFLYRPRPTFFEKTKDDRLHYPGELTERIISNESVVIWLTDVVSRTFSMDFRHWQNDLLAVQDNYTPDAFYDLIQEIKNKKILDVIMGGRLILSSRLLEAPVIRYDGVNSNGQYAWYITFPLDIVYRGGEKDQTITQNVLVEALVVRVNYNENIRGIQIARLFLKETKHVVRQKGK
jgi:hypothetical protein